MPPFSRRVFSASCTFFCAMRQYSGSISTPIYCLPVSAAAASVEPLPANRIKHQRTRFCGRLHQLPHKGGGLFIRVQQFRAVQALTLDHIVRTAVWQDIPPFGGKDTGIIPRGKAAFQIAHAVVDAIPYDYGLDGKACDFQRVYKRLLYIPAAETQYSPPSFKTR